MHVHGQINVSGVSSPVGPLRISMPFTCANLTEGGGNSCGSILVAGGVSATMNQYIIQIDEGNNFATVYLGTGTGLIGAVSQQIQPDVNIKISISYSV